MAYETHMSMQHPAIKFLLQSKEAKIAAKKQASDTKSKPASKVFTKKL